ncbi:NTP transferase domain-containing protein [Pelagibacterales bacterium SAG-MED41]|nr:NTP transferase domain-containing protein [Pelagibacterales bacterium SAG-MED41]|tara:strand:+ start:3330 stop:4199 length:870 start_codon:yes stop_codon:yes gene_type:complete
MIRKGIILAGGRGLRMSPLTLSVNKQLLPLYDKPLIFYPLSVLMSIGIKRILIIVNKGQLKQFRKILPEKNNLGISIKYKEQAKPGGLPQAFTIGKKFIGNDSVSLILGDNFFYGKNLSKILRKNINLDSGVKIFIHPVKKPSLYGIATIDKNKKVINLVEKPKKTNSKFAVTGLYFFDNQVINLTKKLKPSKRGELEIIDLLKFYKKLNKLKAEFIGNGSLWLDTGDIKSFYRASNFVSNIESKKGLKIGCIEEVAFKNKWINKKQMKNAINFYGKCNYSKYLQSLIV